MKSIKSLKFVALGLAASSAVLSASASGLSVEVGYSFAPISPDFGPEAAPDTGWVKISNTDSSPFVGSISLSGLSTFAGAFLTTSGSGYTLAPAASVVLTLNNESSNFGNYNPDGAGGFLGAQLSISGLLGACAVGFVANDKDIHSGAPRTNPFGETLDNFILAGGTAGTGDTFDTYEVEQAHAFFTVPTSCPDAGSTVGLMAFGLGAIVAGGRKLA